MELSYLNWDSEFFNKRIYKAAQSGEFSESDLQALSNLEADLVYIFTSATTPALQDQLIALDAKLYDRKVTYQKPVSFMPINTTMRFEPVTKLTPKLIDLAYQSGLHSRFRLDPLLTHKFNELYYTWIRRSVNKELADEVIVALAPDNKEVGFLSLSKSEDGSGTIQLIAVDANFRGQKIGSQLVNKADEWFDKRNVHTGKVVTQLDNLSACRLYESANYQQHKIEYIFHYWKP